ncbi:redoxin family protein [Micromonospora sp. NPDC048842]|uniref:redoxin family protein n=1 Tax=Micromonospora sp. NPDC048842 TaxID=3154346 RepID=UPI0033EA8B46
MTLLTAAVTIVGLLCLFDLVLTLGVIRRLRHHSELLSKRPAAAEPFQPIKVPVGGTVGDFTTTTVDGSVLTRDGLRPGTLVAFLSTTCPACAEQLPTFIERISASSGTRDMVVAVLSGEEPALESMRAQLEPHAMVVIESPIGPVSSAFEVSVLPSFVVLDAGGLVRDMGVDAEEVLVPTPAGREHLTTTRG